jgi:hypothetical protein
VNQIVAAADSWLAPHEYDANERDGLAPLEHAEPGRWRGGDVVTFGFDGGRTDDSSALVAVRVNDGARSSSASGRSPSAPAAAAGRRSPFAVSPIFTCQSSSLRLVDNESDDRSVRLVFEPADGVDDLLDADIVGQSNDRARGSGSRRRGAVGPTLDAWFRRRSR